MMHKHPGSFLTGLRNFTALGTIIILSGCAGTGAPPPDGSDGQPKPPWAKSIGELSDRMDQTDQNQRNALADLNNRLALMERQLGSLQGHVEQVRHESKRLTERIDQMPPPEARTAAVPGAPTADITPPPPQVAAVTPSAPAAANVTTPAPATVANVTTPAAPAAGMTKPPASVQPAVPQPAVAAASAAAASVTAAAAAKNTSSPSSAKEAYEAAFLLLKQKQFDASLAGFQNFLKAHPKDANADNAQYWVGELHFAQRRFPEALMAFNQVLVRWPTSGKVPDSLLKIGYTFYELNDFENANTSLQRLVKDFPNSTPATVGKQRLNMIKQKLGR
ncbi:MAG: tol-pal system protein YbgF [Magnetococcus sp. YQC-5]